LSSSSTAATTTTNSATTTTNSATIDYTYNDQRPCPFVVKPIPNRGLASFAATSYSAGDVIFRENPLVWVPFHWPFATKKQLSVLAQRLRALSPADRSLFYASANVYDVPPLAPNAAAGVFYTNSFDMCDAKHGKSCAIYPMLARLNHSCEPNTRQEFDIETLEEVLYASEDIAAGDQLFDSYTDLDASVKTRRKELRKYYRFDCDCPRCMREGGPPKQQQKKATAASDPPQTASPPSPPSPPDISKLDIRASG
jgi:hypothetical protein